MPRVYEFAKEFEPPIDPVTKEGKKLIHRAGKYIEQVTSPRNYDESTLHKKGAITARDVVVCAYADGAVATCWWIGCLERYAVRARTSQEAYDLLLQQLYYRNINIDEDEVLWIESISRSNKYPDIPRPAESRWFI